MAASTQRLFSLLSESTTRYDLEKIQRAFDVAEEAHRGQFRKSGEEYIYHPLAVAEICAELDTGQLAGVTSPAANALAKSAHPALPQPPQFAPGSNSRAKSIRGSDSTRNIFTKVAITPPNTTPAIPISSTA
jgi:hypothetical protein